MLWEIYQLANSRLAHLCVTKCAFLGSNPESGMLHS